MEKCVTCKFFGEANHLDDWNEKGESRETKHHICDKVIHINASSNWVNHGYNKGRDDLAVVIDGEGYIAKLLVLPDFGCILHQPKEQEDGSASPS